MKPRVGLFLLLVAGCGGRPQPSPQPSSRPLGPNVLLITIDTLRADHLGTYGYHRSTSPHIDALARESVVFDEAFTYWPKTRGSMVILHTGRLPSKNGYTRSQPELLPFNPTLASLLRAAGYHTLAAVDNPNVAAIHGYAKGFDQYRETWEDSGLQTEYDRSRAITETALRILAAPPKPFFLWLHYVNPHAPYTPPPPFDRAFLDKDASKGPRLGIVPGFHGGIHKEWALSGHDLLGYYIAEYDGEIATADEQVGRVLDYLRTSPAWKDTVVILLSDHGESLGEHGYYFDHGEDLFDPCLRIPLIVRMPGSQGGRRSAALVSTLDIVPTVLDAARISYPADLAGSSLLPAVRGREMRPREVLFAQNDRDLSARFDARYKIVESPEEKKSRYALYDRKADPAETRDVFAEQPEESRAARRGLEVYLERQETEWGETRRLLHGGTERMTPKGCEELKALGYLPSDFKCPDA